jgi:ATP-dependent DNA helicase RecQ
MMSRARLPERRLRLFSPAIILPMAPRPSEILKSVFGYEGFRPMQEAVIEAVLSGEDALAVMPTGGGKSLCYQVPALILPGLTLVVSPLISLMRDQVAFLRELGLPALVLNSSLSPEEWGMNARAIRRLGRGLGRGGQGGSGGDSPGDPEAGEEATKLLYLAPETLLSPRGRELLDGAPVRLIAVDEAHCISEWGHDFRPEYRALGGLREAFPEAPCLALTATATERVRADIKSALRLRPPAGAVEAREFVAPFDRPNIFLEAKLRADAAGQILELASRYPAGSGIVYCFSRARSEALAAELSARGLAALPYHAGLADEIRSGRQDAFVRDEFRVITATTAFGMGIDKPDVRFVAHADLPRSLEQYYQEIGRAGRDGLPAGALLLYSYGDAAKIRALLGDKEGAEAEAAEASLREMLRYAESTRCRRARILAHFGERRAGLPCGSCDVCAPESAALVEAEEDVTVQAYKLLSCVKRTGERFGAGHVADVLVGSRNDRLLGLGHANLSTYGIGKEWPRDRWMELARALTRKGYLAKDEEFGVLRLTEKAYEAMRERKLVAAALPQARQSRKRRGAEPSLGAFEPRTAPGSPGAVPEAGSVAAGATAAGAATVEELAARLRSLRRRLAEEGRVPPYMIFPDRTLLELASKRPAGEAELLGVFGLGPVKVRRYGRALLEALREAGA